MDGDCISYSIYLPEIPLADSTEKYKYLEAKLCGIYTFLCEQTNFANHFWNYERFNLVVGSHPGLLELKGSTQVKDNIEDEWYITFLLYEISRNFTDVIIQLVDRDGDFLLIEAADHLPHWLQPNTATNRVFIHSSKLHIIPLPQTPSDIPHLPVGDIPLIHSVQLIWNQKINTICNEEIQQCIVTRFMRASESSKVTHFANCQLPLNAAKVLSVRPELLAHSVHAVYERNSNEKQALKFDIFSPDDFITIRLEFSRFLFAKLKNCRFSFQEKCPNAPSTSTPGSQSYILGAKITTGLEILASEKCGCKIPSQSGPSIGEDKLVRKGSGYFIKNVDDYFPTSRIVEDILKHSNLTKHDILETSNQLPPPSDEGWLKVNENELDGLLNQADTLSGLSSEYPNDIFDLDDGDGDGAQFHSKSYFDPEGIQLQHSKFIGLKQPEFLMKCHSLSLIHITCLISIAYFIQN